MKEFEDVMDNLIGSGDERLLDLARFAELGMSASAVIHEVRQPMTALAMSLQILRDGVAANAPQLVEQVDEAISFSRKIEMLLERTRDFMRPSTGWAPFDLLSCVERVVSVFQWQLGKHSGIELKLSLPSQIPSMVGDKTQVEQMVANLMANAIDAVKDVENGCILLRVSQVADQLQLLVADNGLGIEDEAREKIFTPFFSTKGHAKGTGLGLYIVSKVAKRHGASCDYLGPQELLEMQIEGFQTGFLVAFDLTRGSLWP